MIIVLKNLYPRMIQVKLSGRVGNQMYQYCIARIVAMRNGYNFYIPPKGSSENCGSTEGYHLVDLFPNIDLGVKDAHIERFYEEDHRSQKYDPSILNLPNNTVIRGFFQSDKYYDGFESEIRKWFTVDSIDIGNKCVIHLRGSDYKTHTHWMLPPSYYKSAMEVVIKMDPHLEFLIVTDDIEYCNFHFPNIECVSNNMRTDFGLIYSSKYSIISNSTFSWWAAWLSDKKVTIAPNYWLNYNRPDLGFYPMDIKTNKFTYV